MWLLSVRAPCSLRPALSTAVDCGRRPPRHMCWTLRSVYPRGRGRPAPLPLTHYPGERSHTLPEMGAWSPVGSRHKTLACRVVGWCLMIWWFFLISFMALKTNLTKTNCLCCLVLRRQLWTAQDRNTYIVIHTCMYYIHTYIHTWLIIITITHKDTRDPVAARGANPPAVVGQTISGHNFIAMCQQRQDSKNDDPYACVRAAAWWLHRLQLAACIAGCPPATIKLMSNNDVR